MLSGKVAAELVLKRQLTEKSLLVVLMGLSPPTKCTIETRDAMSAPANDTTTQPTAAKPAPAGGCGDPGRRRR